VNRSLSDYFPFGKAPTVLLAVTLVAGAYLGLNPIHDSEATLRLWTFARQHCQAYVDATPAFEAAHPGTKLEIQLVHGDAVSRRLRAAFWADLDVPDLVEVPIDRAASFFRGPVEDVGFMDLQPYLQASGFGDRIVQTRLAPYTSRGRVFGIPHDVHPVMLAYRRDIFEAEGIDPAHLQTWDDFVRVARRITVPGERYMIELNDAKADEYNVFLYQAGGGLFDADGNLTMDSEIALETLIWFTPLAAGPERIGSSLGSTKIFTQAIETGYFVTLLCPDWRTRLIEIDVPRMRGKMALMPLPAFEPGGCRTSVRGGTMLGITTATPDKDLAWAVAAHMYLDSEELAARFRETNILPPLKDAWVLPAFLEPRPYWSNQPLGKLYADVAEEVPAWYTSPFSEKAIEKMGQVVAACAAYYREHGDDGFRDFARQRLHAAASQVRHHVERNPF